jgi:hypothetical protein
MTFKDNMRNKTGDFLTKSQELFEKIFAQATRELKIKRKPKAAAQKPATATASGTPRTEGGKPKIAMDSGKVIVTYKTSEKVKASPKPKPKGKPTARKGSRVLRTSLLFVLLLVLAGFAANYFGVIDLSVVPDLLGLGPKQVVQVPIPRKEKVKPPQPEVKAPAAATPPSVPTPPAVSKEQKLVELETPTTIAPPPAKERTEEKAPSVAEQPQPSPPQSAVKEEPPPVPVQPQVSEKPGAPQTAPSQLSTPQYPYSVYLGSFKAAEAVNKALSDYQEKGLSAYWAKVDLGEKGVWYRFFTGYFRTKEEAEKYIRDRDLRGAASGITKFANLIGSYGSEKEVEDQKRALVSAGFYPYVIKDADGKSLLYSGAFDRKEYAEKERDALAGKGIKSEVVER